MNAPSLRLAAFCASLALLVTTASAKVTERFSQTLPLPATGTVSLTNLNGDIEIIGWDKAEVSIEAEKTARDDDGLKRMEIVVEASTERIAIKTKHRSSENESWWRRHSQSHGSVRYTVRVPAALAHLNVDAMNSNISTQSVRGDVKLETMNGRIRAIGLSGNADLDTMNGRITASFDRFARGQTLKCDTMNGSCEILLPTDTSARLDASSFNGRVSCDLPVTIRQSSRRSLQGEIGAGEGTISLDSMNGSLSLHART